MMPRLLALLPFIFFVGQAHAVDPSLDYFKELNKSMTRLQVHKDVGEPTRVMGSGVVIDVYGLADGSEVSIVWSGSEGNMLYVSHGTTTLVK